MGDDTIGKKNLYLLSQCSSFQQEKKYKCFKLNVFIYLCFTVLSRIFHLYRADRSSNVGKNLTIRKKNLTFPTCDPSEVRTTAV